LLILRGTLARKSLFSPFLLGDYRPLRPVPFSPQRRQRPQQEAGLPQQGGLQGFPGAPPEPPSQVPMPAGVPETTSDMMKVVRDKKPKQRHDLVEESRGAGAGGPPPPPRRRPPPA
jgi:hypothetical protein